ncbi:indole-3-acetaldehyde oxidase, partial [Aplysia californica]|uniref:Indole-3-acetaldehyde oxidase n=1 Tax=Aplysia californica TaxID=6500 RepID=A0ABM0JI84_APLCA
MATKEMFKRPGDPHDISFYINGTKHEVSDKFPPTTSLNDYIRDVAGLKGTKVMCKEAGCGCCAVAVTHAFAGDKMETMSINSCLCPLYSIDGWQISTVEGIGSQRDGFHPIQERIAEYNGTQCGYCTPGFVMGMYGLLHKDSKPTQQEIEDSLDSHVCRCTGYRAILDAMKSFGSDATSPGAKCIDIEDLNMKLCPKTGDVCKREGGTGCASSSKADTHLKGHAPTPLTIDLRGSKWYRPLCLADLGWILRQHEAQSTRMVFGNTGAGIYKHEGPFEIYIDLRAVKELHKVEESDTSILFGAGTTITKFKDYLQTVQQKPGFHYSSRVVRHLKVVANVLVRNAGSMAGNLMIKHKHPDFPSDLFTILTAIDAQVDIFDSQSSQTTRHSMMEFLKEINMDGKVLVAVEIPALGEKDHYRSFKITPRWQNAHAYVNAAFKITVDGRRVVGKPNCVFGGLNSETVNVTAAEDFLKDKELNNAVITQTLKILYSEIDPSCDPILSSPNYRKNLAVNLLYKALLEIYKPSKLSLQSGADSMERPLSVGLQTFQEKPEDFPLKKPTPKVTAPLQASGEAVYINDIPTYQKELHAAFVISDVGPAKIAKVDASAALNIPGVVNFLGAADIPREGVNNSVPANPLLQWTEELFASEVVEYAGQGIGIILAETQALAEEGARQVQISYEDVQKPIVDIEEAIEKNTIFESATQERIVGDPEGMSTAIDSEMPPP